MTRYIDAVCTSLRNTGEDWPDLWKFAVLPIFDFLSKTNFIYHHTKVSGKMINDIFRILAKEIL